MKNQHVDKAKDLYLKNLKFSNLSNWMLHTLFSSFNLMFRMTSKVNKTTFFNSTFTIIDNCELPEEVLGLKFNLTLEDGINSIIFNFRLACNDTQYCHKTFKFDIYDDSVNFYDFIQEWTKEIIDKFVELSNGEQSMFSIEDSAPQKLPIQYAPSSSYMKKIINIQEVGQMHRYHMVFEDNTSHSILTPELLTIKPGDYGHDDGRNGFMFIASRGVN